MQKHFCNSRREFVSLADHVIHHGMATLKHCLDLGNVLPNALGLACLRRTRVRRMDTDDFAAALLQPIARRA